MRKISLGIFAVLTVILFILSIAPSVTGADYNLNLFDLETIVHDHSPWAEAKYIEKDSGLKQTGVDTYIYYLEVNRWAPLDVEIQTQCFFTDDYVNQIYKTGHHTFTVYGAYYKNQPWPNQEDEDEVEIQTSGHDGGCALFLHFYDVKVGGRIVISYYTCVKNILENADIEAECTVVIHLISRSILQPNINIDPNTLNLKSKGRWITCYIDLPEGYDVNNIEISTVMLEDTIPAEWGDIQGDTLMVKFDRSDVEDMLSPGTYNLKVTGELTDGTMFEGYSDEIRVIEPP